MRIVSLVVIVLVVFLGCSSPPAPPVVVDPKPGDSVRVRGTLDTDVDCRLLRTEDGKVFSLSIPLRNLLDGSRICVYGTVSQATQCMHTPGIDVDQIRPWSACR